MKNIPKIFIRRTITFTMYVTWLLLTIFTGIRYLNGIELPNGFIQFYMTFSSAITIIISFYFKGKKEEVEAD